MVTKNDIFRFLEDCKIKSNDIVTMHSALRSVGPIEGGADGLIDAVCAYLTDGLFLVPTHTWANVNKEHPHFDVRTTEPCIGTLAKVAAFRADGVRSLHPTHSMAAFGQGAAAYVAGEERHATPAPVGGALSRLYEKRGKILLVGVGHERNTYLHAAEERLGIPDRLNPETFDAVITDHNGKELLSPAFHSHHTEAVEGGISEYYPNYKEAFEYCGAVTYHRLGGATVYCCDARKMTDLMQTIWERSGHTDVCLVHAPVAEGYYKE